MAPLTKAYVFAMTPAGRPEFAGEMRLLRSRGEFSYAMSWLAHKDRYPLDPVNLPLQPGAFVCRHNGGVFPVFSDAGPDAWGTKIMLLNRRSQPANEIERLLSTDGGGVGSIRFSLSRSRPKERELSTGIELLKSLHLAVEAVDGPEPPTDSQLRLVAPGSSMGGARPKVNLHDGRTDYLAKFSRATDLVDSPRVEFAMMTMLADTALNVPKVRLEPVGKGRSAFLIERFDRAAGTTTNHYISAHALFNVSRFRELPDGRLDPAGYVALARVVRAHSYDAQRDGSELFLRALTNIVVGNTDDHARNFGMSYNLADKRWSLAPVFDVLPIVSSRHTRHAMSLGVGGREGTWANLLSCHREFGLDQDEAHRLAHEHLQVLQHWRTYFEKAGVSPSDMRILDAVIGPRLSDTLNATAFARTTAKLSDFDLDSLDVSADPAHGQGFSPGQSR